MTQNIQDGPVVNRQSTRIGHNRPPADQGGGWVAIRRAMREHWLVGFGQSVKPCDPELGAYSKAEAFIDLIMECRYEGRTVNNNGRKMRLEPGQLLGAVSWLASRWNWTPKTVRGFLDKLEEDAMIDRVAPGVNTSQSGKQEGKQAAVITLCNYLSYQIAGESKGQEAGLVEGMQGASKGHEEGNIYKDNKGTREQGNTTPSSQQQAPDVLAGLNGAAYPMIESIRAWSGMPEANARQWLANSIRLLGEEPIKQAYQQVDTKLKTNHTISQPLQLWSKIARDNGKKPPAEDRSAVLKAQRDKIRAEMGWKDNG